MLGAHMDEAVVGVADVEVGVEEVEEAWEFDPEFFVMVCIECMFCLLCILHVLKYTVNIC